MNRKHFLHQLAATTAALGIGNVANSAPTTLLTDPPRLGGLAQPPFLVAGDIIGITCPASPIERRTAFGAQTILEGWGYKTCMGNTVGRQWERFGGSDDERAADLQLMLNDPSVKAILFARGGYGAMRMMDKVDWSVLKQQPKWLIGFSDMTAIHCQIQALTGTPTIHGDMVVTLKAGNDISSISLQQVLSGRRIEYSAPAYTLNRGGQAAGLLVGGNISLVAAMLGSKSDLQTDGKILFLEEVSEYKYTLDRMMMSLKRAGKLDKLAGLIIGGITATKADSETHFPMSVEQIIFEKVKEHRYPVAFNFPAGHIANNLALKLGVHYNLYVNAANTLLSEIADPHAPLPMPIIGQDSVAANRG